MSWRAWPILWTLKQIPSSEKNEKPSRYEVIPTPPNYSKDGCLVSHSWLATTPLEMENATSSCREDKHR